MTKFGDWIRTFDIWSNDFDRDLANLTAQLEEALAQECWHANTGAGGYDIEGAQPGRNCMEAEEYPAPDDRGCPGRCKPCLALAACKEFQEKYDA